MMLCSVLTQSVISTNSILSRVIISVCSYGSRHVQVAGSRDVAQDPQRGAFRRAPGSSPPSDGGNRPQTRPSQPPRSTSSASAATQDSSATEYARTDSGGSARDPAGASERRASGAAAGMYLIQHFELDKALAGNLWPKCASSKLHKAASVCCCVQLCPAVPCCVLVSHDFTDMKQNKNSGNQFGYQWLKGHV